MSQGSRPVALAGTAAVFVVAALQAQSARRTTDRTCTARARASQRTLGDMHHGAKTSRKRETPATAAPLTSRRSTQHPCAKGNHVAAL